MLIASRTTQFSYSLHFHYNLNIFLGEYKTKKITFEQIRKYIYSIIYISQSSKTRVQVFR